MIYIGFSEPKKFKIGAYAIKLWTNAPYSHVYIRFVNSNPAIPSNVYHAASGMVHFKTFENFKKDSRIIKEYELPVSPEMRTEILAHCMNLSGEPYGAIELLKILITDILHFLGIKLKTYDGKGYICSELVGTIMHIVFGKDIFDKPMHLVKPKDIDLFLAKIIPSQ